MKKIQSFKQFSTLRRFLLKLGLDVKPIPFDAEELFLLADILGIEARDLGVASSGKGDSETEQALLRSALAASVDGRAKLQQRVREELGHRKQAVNVVIAMLAVIVAILAAVSSSLSAKSSSQSAASAQAAINIILKR